MDFEEKLDVERSEREKKIMRVTVAGGIVNMALLIFKFVAGIVGHSSAMIADAVHSFSDFLTDIVVIVFVKLGSQPQDETHDYGHGKFETLATLIIGLALVLVGVMIAFSGIQKIIFVLHGGILPSPGLIAFIAALVSVVSKEWTYRFTYSAGKKYKSETVVANAWHHRSDALSSVGTALGIGGAIFLGSRWTVLDPIAAVAVSFFIVKVAYTLIRQSIDELLEKSLPQNVETEITDIAESEPGVSGIHHLCTRRIGNDIAIEMHLRLPSDMTVYDAHEHATNIERNLRNRFGNTTHISLHVEPTKINGEYVKPNV